MLTFLQAVTYWCMVFGTDKNQTHWKHLSSNKKLSTSFKRSLFAQTSLNEATWSKYWKSMITFRNEYAAHRSLHSTPPVPFLDCALEVAYSYDRWVREIISPDIFEEPLLKDSAVDLQRLIKPVVRELLSAPAANRRSREQQLS